MIQGLECLRHDTQCLGVGVTGVVGQGGSRQGGTDWVLLVCFCSHASDWSDVGAACVSVAFACFCCTMEFDLSRVERPFSCQRHALDLPPSSKMRKIDHSKNWGILGAVWDFTGIAAMPCSCVFRDRSSAISGGRACEDADVHSPCRCVSLPVLRR